mgnify:FL=1
MIRILSYCLNLLFFVGVLFGDVGRLLEPLNFNNLNQPGKVGYRGAALIAPMPSKHKSEKVSEKESHVILDRVLLERTLGEALSHRYQATGKVLSYVTREWSDLKVSSNFFLKIRDCAPDELAPSSFVRFEVWDEGDLVGQFSEPIRMAHMMEVFFTTVPFARGNKPSSAHMTTRSVDVLKQHAGSVFANAKLSGYQLNSNLKAGSPLKWNHLTKVTLVQKGKIVDVFASGNGIYVSMKGMALQDGVEGGLVKVRNLSSEKEFQARVLNENSVKVHL